MSEVEALNLSRRTAVALLEREQALGRRQPQRARQPKERALFLVVVHHGGDPLAGINRAGDLSRNGTKRVGIAGGCANHSRYLKHTGGSSPALAADQRQETVLHGGDTKRTQRRGHFVGRKRREGRRLKVELDGRIGANCRNLAAQ